LPEPFIVILVFPLLENTKLKFPLPPQSIVPSPVAELPNKEIVYAVEFVPTGTFGAIGAAQNYLKDLGYTIGSMQMSSPIGFADSDKYDYVSKWWNMNRTEQGSLDGAIIPLDGFREGGNLVLFFKEPKL
jgi:hypothetical protein